jgi:hypothetical protein
MKKRRRIGGFYEERELARKMALSGKIKREIKQSFREGVSKQSKAVKLIQSNGNTTLPNTSPKSLPRSLSKKKPVLVRRNECTVKYVSKSIVGKFNAIYLIHQAHVRDGPLRWTPLSRQLFVVLML